MSQDLTRHHETPRDDSIWVGGRPEPVAIAIAAYDPAWPARFQELAARVRAALGDKALSVEHVGSTSVPGLAAKPVIDIALTVADPADESAYLPELEEAGFRLVIREPAWHEHRALKSARPNANLHVWGPGCPEVERQRMFRQWLIDHPEDLARYQEAKTAAAAEANAAGEIVTEYNRRKQPVIQEIYERMFRSHGLL
ncbi:GrpB family protein [Glycomyces terrestris]|uniref:GrpB family protein n=1 Tax=Glycomyces terrestris TaxID=2493553 RepID=A0A426V0R0_9ACTN|nr:GrpB family protein [Glycomyces terrestris]RRS00442.1 GrpB family protein [Glycomyces terrestris]